MAGRYGDLGEEGRAKFWEILYRGTPKSSILIGFSLINHSFLGTTIFGNTHIEICIKTYFCVPFCSDENTHHFQLWMIFSLICDGVIMMLVKKPVLKRIPQSIARVVMVFTVK